MIKPSEVLVELNLITQLVGFGYQSVVIADGSALVSDLKSQLQPFEQAANFKKYN